MQEVSEEVGPIVGLILIVNIALLLLHVVVGILNFRAGVEGFFGPGLNVLMAIMHSFLIGMILVGEVFYDQ